MIELIGGIGLLVVLVLVARTAYDFGYQAGREDALEDVPAVRASLDAIHGVVEAIERDIKQDR